MEIWACTSYVIFHWNVIIVSMQTVARLCFSFHSDHSDTVISDMVHFYVLNHTVHLYFVLLSPCFVIHWICCLTESVQ